MTSFVVPFNSVGQLKELHDWLHDNATVDEWTWNWHDLSPQQGCRTVTVNIHNENLAVLFALRWMR